MRGLDPPVSTAWNSRLDWLVYCLLAILTAYALLSARVVPTIGPDQHCYLKLAESLTSGKGYTISGPPQTHFPPGWPVILAVIGQFAGWGYRTDVSAGIIFGGFGLLLAYLFIREREGRPIAAAATLIVAMSGVYFDLATTWVLSELPFLFFLYATFLAIRRVEKSDGGALNVVGACMLLSMAVMVRTVGIVLLAALFAWLFFSRDTRNRGRLAIVLAVGTAVTGLWFAWCYWNRQASSNYVAEVIAGGTSARVMAERIVAHLAVQGVDLSNIGPLYWRREWYAPACVLPLVGIAAAILPRLWQRKFTLLDWFVLFWILIFELYTDAGDRYSIPARPILYLYCWRGWQAILTAGWSQRAMLWSALTAGAIGLGSLLSVHVHYPSAQAMLGGLFWAILAVALLLLALLHQTRDMPPRAPVTFVPSRYRGSLLAAGVVAACLAGLSQQVLKAGQNNLGEGWQPTVRLADWIDHNLKTTDTILVTEGIDCELARLTPIPAFSWPDGLSASDEQRILAANHVRYVITTKFFFESDQRNKIARLTSLAPGLLKSYYQGPEFEVLAVQN